MDDEKLEQHATKTHWRSCAAREVPSWLPDELASFYTHNEVEPGGFLWPLTRLREYPASDSGETLLAFPDAHSNWHGIGAIQIGVSDLGFLFYLKDLPRGVRGRVFVIGWGCVGPSKSDVQPEDALCLAENLSEWVARLRENGGADPVLEFWLFGGSDPELAARIGELNPGIDLAPWIPR